MKKRIYNKKNFWIGVFFLLLGIMDSSLLIIHYNDRDTMEIIKSVLLNIFCVLFGGTQVYRSINSKCAKEDEQNEDEREKLITIKAKSSAYNMTLFICITITILSTIAFGVTKIDALGGFLVGIGIVPTIMIFAVIGSYFYHEKRN